MTAEDVALGTAACEGHNTRKVLNDRDQLDMIELTICKD